MASDERVTLKVVHGFECDPGLTLQGRARDLPPGTRVMVADRIRGTRLPDRLCVTTADGQVSAWGEDGYDFGAVE